MVAVLAVIALIATLAVLMAGIVVMLRGGDFNARWGNKLMQARVALQALAIGLLFILFLLSGSGD